MIQGSNYLPPQSVWVTSKVPYFDQLRSVYRPYGPLQGLGQLGVAAAEGPVWLDVRWWGKTLATAGLVFGGLYILARI